MNDRSTEPRPPRVFISYSHDSDAHCKLVLALSERLRDDGIDAYLDQYVQGTPPEKWPRWMLNRLDWADFVLLVCTETYYRRFRGQEEPDIGKGVDWEGAVITNALYDERNATLKFVPVLFDPADQPFIPEPVRGSFYCLISESRYRDLYDFLRGQAGTEPRPLGQLRGNARNRGEPLSFPVIEGEPAEEQARSSEASPGSGKHGVALPPGAAFKEAVMKEFPDLDSTTFWQGRVLYNPSDRMKQGARERVEVRISQGMVDVLTEGLKGLGAPTIHTIQVSRFMSVRLAGETFEIRALGNEGQYVPASGFAQWEWDVVPKKWGTHTLQLKVTARLKLDGLGEEPMDLPVLDKTVSVQVSPLYVAQGIASRHGVLIASTILVPAVAWLMAQYVAEKPGDPPTHPELSHPLPPPKLSDDRNALGCETPSASVKKLYLYKDQHAGVNFRPLVSLTTPPIAAENSHVAFGLKAGPGVAGYDGTGDAAVAEFRFKKQIVDAERGAYVYVEVREGYMGLILATNDAWGKFPGGLCLDLRRARGLHLRVRSDSDAPPARVKISAFTMGDDPFGDTAGHKFDVGEYSVGTHWIQIDKPVQNASELSRVVTPLVLVVNRIGSQHRVAIYLDEVYYEME